MSSLYRNGKVKGSSQYLEGTFWKMTSGACCCEVSGVHNQNDTQKNVRQEEKCQITLNAGGWVGPLIIPPGLRAASGSEAECPQRRK